ncbi:DALR anticodon-binding domain-containing protein [Streptomyces sp. NBC_01352]|uniref:ArgS-related anticodon-binding protein NrtL n=1 Tax=unclassified Streptomyces TaxID=2593676 RepID=UPI00225136D1|nr:MULTISPECIES: DALR anticodon-binding domain-containing protein [unclassified Streptomyces]MCX4697915.1 DALR anticodon-binding domain-containing protein [Streptomyces sp. NBC_01373]
MTPVELSRTVLRAVRRAVDEGELSVTVPGRAVVTPPGPGGCGDYATNIALQLARPAGRPPLQVAEVLLPYLLAADAVTDVVVTGPGFLNISLRSGSPAVLVEEILRRGKRYGHAHGPDAQPLVPLHAPHEVRAVVVMDAAARILRSQGAFVRTTCEAPVQPEWTDILGVRVDSHGPAATPGLFLRPVPAPVDPLPLGRDAARWALLHPAPHDRPRLTDDHLVQRESNPLFRVRYAHARTRALSRNAADLGFTAEPGDVQDARALENALADHLRVLTQAASQRTPDRLARHLVTVADAALPLLPTVLPRGDEKPSAAHRARLALAEAAGAVLAGGLSLLGIDAPQHL